MFIASVCLSVCLSVRPSVCLSEAKIWSKICFFEKKPKFDDDIDVDADNDTSVL